MKRGNCEPNQPSTMSHIHSGLCKSTVNADNEEILKKHDIQPENSREIKLWYNI